VDATRTPEKVMGRKYWAQNMMFFTVSFFGFTELYAASYIEGQ